MPEGEPARTVGAGKPSARLFDASNGKKTEVPLPEVSQPDATTCGVVSKVACIPGAIVQLPDGSLLAAVHPDSRMVPKDDLFGEWKGHDRWEFLRYSGGAWASDSLTFPGASWDEPRLFEGEPTLLSSDKMWLRVGASWTELSGLDAAPVAALGLGGPNVIVAWETESKQPYPGTKYPENDLHAAAWDGQRWLPRDAGLPVGSAGSPDFAISPDGRVLLAYETDSGEVQLRWWDGARWMGLDGSDSPGGVSDSPAWSGEASIGFIDDRVCVAWAEAAELEPQVSVRCHALP